MAYLYPSYGARAEFRHQHDLPCPRRARRARAGAAQPQGSAAALSRLPLQDASRGGSSIQLRQLERRIHILEGFAIVFKGLEQALKIIRASQGKADAAARLMKAFPLDAEQTDAVLELALYRISSLEIDRIVEELKEKTGRGRQHPQDPRLARPGCGKSSRPSWKRSRRSSPTNAARRSARKTRSPSSIRRRISFARIRTSCVTRDGWIKRVGRLQKVESTRVREGDSVLAVVPGSTLENVVVFSSDGVAYTLPIEQVPASSGYGDPLSKFVRVGDGARTIWAVSTDPRFTPADATVRKNLPPAPYLLIATRSGQVMQLSFSTFRLPRRRPDAGIAACARGTA